MHPFAATRDQYDEAMALARQMARERDERFAQLKESEAEADRLRVALADAAEYLRLAHTWIVDTDRHYKAKAAWERARAALNQQQDQGETR